MTTLEESIRRGDAILAVCTRCNRCRRLDLAALAGRFGPRHGSMHADLVPKLRCTGCSARGERAGVGIIVSPDAAHGRWHGGGRTAQ